LAVVARENKATIQPIGSGLQAFTQLACAMSLKRFGDEIQQRQRAPRLRGFRLAYLEAAINALERSGYANDTSIEVDVRPLGREQFSAARARGCREQKERSKVFALDRFDELLGLREGERVNLVSFQLRRIGQGGGVAADQSPTERAVKGYREHGANMAH
jgi:hypothetical protein